MQEDILDIRARLQAGSFVNEASVSQGIVLRILGRLSWPTYDTSIVIPEYGLEGRRVDYALCHPPSKPVVFIEVKQPGEATDAERQLFEYAFHLGVQLAVLTTGQEWQFFLPAERGSYGERRVYGLDLLERSPDESQDRLRRYLEYGSICSGLAIERARDDYRDVAKERDIQRALPEAWGRLVAEQNEALLTLLAEKVESVCGFKPDLSTAAEILRTRLNSHEGQSRSPIPTSIGARVRSHETAPQLQAKPITSSSPQPAQIGLEFLGQWHQARNGSEILVRLLQLVVKRDPGFLDRFMSRSRGKGKRLQIAQSPLELFPGNPGLAQQPSASKEFLPGSWVDVNKSSAGKLQFVRSICEIANLRFDVDVRVRLP